MNLNKKGFTLIELLIAIVLMLSLTILVVVGFTKISEDKKKEADLLTEKQIVTAAEQYFSSNYFYVEYMKENPGTNKIFINLGQLVSDDYLNVTTKTSTEEKYNSCDIVYATYENSVALHYLAYEDIVKVDADGNKTFNENTLKLLGYNENAKDADGEPMTKEYYLKTIGLLDNLGKKACAPSITSVSDIIINQKTNIEAARVINSINWYNKNIPVEVNIMVLIDDADADKPEYIAKNAIDSVTIKNIVDNKETKFTNLPLDGSNYFLKKYLVTLDSDGENKLSVQASTSGGKSAFSENSYSIDKKEPSLRMALYKTNQTSIPSTLPSISSMNSSQSVSNNTWINNRRKCFRNYKHKYIF